MLFKEVLHGIKHVAPHDSSNSLKTTDPNDIMAGFLFDFNIIVHYIFNDIIDKNIICMSSFFFSWDVSFGRRSICLHSSCWAVALISPHQNSGGFCLSFTLL